MPARVSPARTISVAFKAILAYAQFLKNKFRFSIKPISFLRQFQEKNNFRFLIHLLQKIPKTGEHFVN